VLRDFELRKPFFLGARLGNLSTMEARFIGAAVDSKAWSYLFETRARISQQSAIPPNVQVQLPPGQAMPLISGLSRQYNAEVTSQGWVRNRDPRA
jgi:hypothetical protein